MSVTTATRTAKHRQSRAMDELEASREFQEAQHPGLSVKSFEALDLDAIEELDVKRPDLTPLADVYQALRATQYLPYNDPARGRAISVSIRIAHDYLWAASNQVADTPDLPAAPSTAACALVDLNAALLRMQAMHAGKPFAQGPDTDHLPADMAELIAYCRVKASDAHFVVQNAFEHLACTSAGRSPVAELLDEIL